MTNFFETIFFLKWKESSNLIYEYLHKNFATFSKQIIDCVQCEKEKIGGLIFYFQSNENYSEEIFCDDGRSDTLFRSDLDRNVSMLQKQGGRQSILVSVTKTKSRKIEN